MQKTDTSLSRQRRIMVCDTGADAPTKPSSAKWVMILALMLLMVGAFCFVGGVAWQQWTDKVKEKAENEAAAKFGDLSRFGQPETVSRVTTGPEKDDKGGGETYREHFVRSRAEYERMGR